MTLNPQDFGFITPGPNDLITDGDDAITTNATATANALFWRGQKTLIGTENLDQLPTGGYSIWSAAIATNLQMPVKIAGTLLVFRFGTNAGNMLFLTMQLTPRVFVRARMSDNWTAWREITPDTAANTQDMHAFPLDGNASGYKTVPVALTLGNGGASRAPAAGTVRIPINFAPQITRWRLHMRDGNPRFSLTRPTTFRVLNVRLGDRDGLAMTNPRNVASGSATGSDVWVSPWSNASITGERFLQIAYDQASAAPIALAGGCYINPDHRRGFSDSADGFTPSVTCPFDIWIEAEVAPDVPVIAVVGDSNSVGIGTTMPVHDSWLSVLCRRLGALPVHYAHSGDTLANSTDPQAGKWQRWAHLSRPDAVVANLGNNDFASARTATEIQADAETVMKFAQQGISPVLLAATITPRNAEGATSDWETKRRAYNTWIKSHPTPRGVLDIASVVSTDDDTISAPYDADGIHYTTAGHAAIAAAIDAKQLIPTPTSNG